MELADLFKQDAFTDVFCRRCSRPMAIQRFNYADPLAEFNSVDYKCLSCGHEEARPHVPENN